jgi:raffinose/stachyose/melibiose transport system substrate-binding protein
LPQLLTEVLASLNEHRQNGTIHAFLDTVTPANMTDVSYDGLQALLAGQMSPEDFTAAVQAAWEEAKAEGEHLQPGGVSC